jgi:hypothetical protein
MKASIVMTVGAACVLGALACERGQGAVGTAAPTSGVVEPTGDLASGQPCSANGECRTGFCEHPMGSCGANGVCAHVPSCTSEAADYDKRMCGCDGTTYGSGCEARQRRISVVSPGPCR